jgi:hypothetical protein
VLVISLVLTIIIFLILKFWPKKFQIPINAKIKAVLVLLLILISAVVNLKPYFRWAFNPRFDIKNISQDLGKAFDHMHLSGLIAPLLSLYNNHEVHPYSTGYQNPYPDYMQRFKITHIIPTIHAGAIEKTYYEKDFPNEMRHKKLLARFPLWKTYAELYALYPGPDTVPFGIPPESTKIYEGETFYGQNGIPRYDPDASGDYAFLADKSSRGFLLELPAGEFPDGRFKADFRIKFTSIPPKDTPILRIYIIDIGRQRVIVSKNITGMDLKSSQEYQEISLPMYLNKTGNLILRIYSHGITDFWFDRVILSPQ